jgi:hypothetical protein
MSINKKKEKWKMIKRLRKSKGLELWKEKRRNGGKMEIMV